MSGAILGVLSSLSRQGFYFTCASSSRAEIDRGETLDQSLGCPKIFDTYNLVRNGTYHCVLEIVRDIDSLLRTD